MTEETAGTPRFSFGTNCPDGQKCAATTTGCLVRQCQRRGSIPCKHSPQPMLPGQVMTGYASLYECPWCKIESLEREVAALTTQLAEKDKEMVRRLADLLCTVPTGAPFQSVLKRAETAEAQRDEREDMANVGEAFMEQLKRADPSYCWNNCPSEWVFDQINKFDELRTQRDDYKADYFRRHKDAGDEMEARIAAEAQRDELQKRIGYTAVPTGSQCESPPSRESIIEQCAVIAETLTIRVADGPTAHAPYYWIAEEIRALKTGTAQATECETNGTEGLRAELDAAKRVHEQRIQQLEGALTSEGIEFTYGPGGLHWSATHNPEKLDQSARAVCMCLTGDVDAWDLELIKKAMTEYALAETEVLRAELDAAKRALAEKPQERISRYLDIIYEAIGEYESWYANDDYNAQECLDKIIQRMRERTAMTDALAAKSPLG